MSKALPIDEAGAGPRWLVVAFFLHAAAGLASGRVLLLAAAGIMVAEFGGGWLEASPAFPIAADLTTEVAAPDPLGLMAESAERQANFWLAAVGPLAVTPPISAADGWGIAAGLWRLVVWALFGAAIARVAGPHFAMADRPTFSTALGRSFSNWPAQVAGPLVLVAVVFVATGSVWLLGVAARLAWLGAPIALAWPLVGLLAIVAAPIAIAAWAGTPLFFAAWGVERTDAFDAVSTGVAYLYQRPLRVVAYALQAWLVGAAAGALVLAAWQVAAAFALPWFSAVVAGGELSVAASIGRFWLAGFVYLPAVFHAAYFWFAAVGVFLLMRRDIDEKNCDQIDDGRSPATATGYASPADSHSDTSAPDPSESGGPASEA